MENEDRELALKRVEVAIEQINRKYKQKGLIVRLGNDNAQSIPAISTGALVLDKAIGIGGFPQGRITEVYGPESSGKSTIALSIAAQAQALGKTVLYIDAEQALDPVYMRKLGVNLDDLFLCQPDYGEQGLDIAEELIKTQAIDVVIVDSVAALTPKAELEGDMSAQQMGAQARMMSKAMRKLVPLLNHEDNKTLVLFINQIREKIGVMFGCLHADTKVVFTDGRAIPIREVVENEIEGEVWSWNEEAEEFEAKPIIDWHHNGFVSDASDYIHIQTQASDTTNGRFELTVTPDHECLTPKGWIKAKDLGLGDELISKYRKLPENLRGLYEDFELETEVKTASIGVKVVEMRYASSRQMRQRGKYDISIADNHNYLVGGLTNGIIVHNSPETTPGGRALKYNASVRIDLRKIEDIKDTSGNSRGSRVRAKVVKNKVGPPLRSVEFDIIYGQGVDTVGCIVDLLLEEGIWSKNSAWINDENGESFAQGRAKAIEKVSEMPEYLEALKGMLDEKL